MYRGLPFTAVCYGRLHDHEPVAGFTVLTYLPVMPPTRRRGLEDRLADLAAMEHGGPADLAILREVIRGKSGFAIASAARVIAARGLVDLADDLAAAFPRLCERAVERDPQCRGKTAIARALHALDRWYEEVFVVGVTMVQPEPAWGKPEDSAAALRGVCGLAFAQVGRPDALDVLADLLADPHRVARFAAAQALGDAGRPDATALLRYKLRIGDDEPEVLTACVASLLVLAPRGALPLVLSLLVGDDDRSIAAALGLGERRITAAAPALIEWCGHSSPATRARVGYLTLALLRADDATAYLLTRVTDGTRADAIAAGQALATFRDDPALAAQLRAAAAAHPDRAVAAELAKALGP